MSGLNVVDSSGWLEYLADSDRAGWYSEPIEDVEHLIIPVISIYEIFKKVLRERGEDEALQVASSMQSGRVVDLDTSLALEAARYQMPMADSIIYATARVHNATIWTQDEDFQGLPNVRFCPGS